MNRAKYLLKRENSYNKIQFIVSLLQNILDQIFKIFTIVETLVTLQLPPILAVAFAQNLNCDDAKLLSLDTSGRLSHP